MSRTISLTWPLRPIRSPRVDQVAKMFDLDLQCSRGQPIVADLPERNADWQIGLIVGPSGSGKSSVVRRAFGTAVYRPAPWPRHHAVIDAFGPRPLPEVVRLLTAVGLGSPPHWVRPFHQLSAGQQHRCELARALAAPRDLVVFDEFASLLDRPAARAIAAAVGRAIRARHVRPRLVAVTAHNDLAAWLAPDWTVDLANGRCHWGRLRRPSIDLELHRCRQCLWELFAPHHYLSAALNPAAECFVAVWQGQPVCFCAVLGLIGRRGRRRVTRLVTLPEYQGLGIATRVLAAVADDYCRRGLRMNLTTSHPAMIAHCRHSPHWRLVSVKRGGGTPASIARGYLGSLGRHVESFEYTVVPPPHAPARLVRVER